MPEVHGIDVSHFQDVNWSEVPSIGFLACKATQGQHFTDPTFAANWAALRARGTGIRVAYHFLDDSDPLHQAERLSATVGTLVQGETLALDWEQPGTTADQAVAFLSRLDELLPAGHAPILYVGAYFPGARDPRLAGRPLWLPQYQNAATPKSHRPVTVWQFSSSGHIQGVGGRVDINSILDAGSLLRAAGFDNANPGPQPPDTPDPLVAMPLPARPHLIRGATGRAVQVGQMELAYLTGNADPEEIKTATFGPATLAAVVDFQNFFSIWDPDHPTIPTGQLDDHTWAALDMLIISKGEQPGVI